MHRIPIMPMSVVTTILLTITIAGASVGGGCTGIAGILMCYGLSLERVRMRFVRQSSYYE